MKKTKLSLSIALTAIGLALCSTASASYVFVMPSGGMDNNQTMEEAITEVKNSSTNPGGDVGDGAEEVIEDGTLTYSTNLVGNQLTVSGTTTNVESISISFDYYSYMTQPNLPMFGTPINVSETNSFSHTYDLVEGYVESSFGMVITSTDLNGKMVSYTVY
jgi:hypothetical protein